MAKLYDYSSDNIGLHLKNIYNDLELDKNVTTEEFSVVQKEGNREVKRNIKYYNLDAIISVGYRVSTRRIRTIRTYCFSFFRFSRSKGKKKYSNDYGRLGK